jgi:hypothetical protein
MDVLACGFFELSLTIPHYRLVNLIVPDPVRFKARAVMPFVQMENISLFLQACKSPPLNLPSHDTFLTVDLYESKDPAQVLQCIGAFSRAASKLHPSRFPIPVGGKRSGLVSPQNTGTSKAGGGIYGNTGRGVSIVNNKSSVYTNSRPASSITPTRTGDSNSGRWSPSKTSNEPASPGSVSSWSKKSDEGVTSPAWNIAQYGYMGGASQGNLGVSFGARRQITSRAPNVPSIAERQKKKEEEERFRIEAEEAERRQLKEEEEKCRIKEEQKWAEEARKLREAERKKAEQEKLKWQEEEQRWKLDEEKKEQQEREVEANLEAERTGARGTSDAHLWGQFSSQYQAEKGRDSNLSSKMKHSSENSESSRVRALERELDLARERERLYERERQERLNQQTHQAVEEPDLTVRAKEQSSSRPRSRSQSRLPRKTSDEVWRSEERSFLQEQWYAQNQNDGPAVTPSKPPRPLPEPRLVSRVNANHTGSRPLPNPAIYSTPAQSPAKPFSPGQNRTDRYLSSNPAPQMAQPKTTYSDEIGGFDGAAERDAEDRRRIQSQQKTTAAGWASKSLLEREMEMERQRQQEWEESQKKIQIKASTSDGVDGIGGGIGGKWDVNQWTGHTGVDSQSRGTQGIGSGRRQIVGPRPPPSGR